MIWSFGLEIWFFAQGGQYLDLRFAMQDIVHQPRFIQQVFEGIENRQGLLIGNMLQLTICDCTADEIPRGFYFLSWITGARIHAQIFLTLLQRPHAR